MEWNIIIHLLALFAAFIIGFFVSLCLRCLNRPKTVGGMPHLVEDGKARRPIPSRPVNKAQLVPVQSRCCKILIFPDTKLPCKSYYEGLIDNYGLRECSNHSCDRLHRNPETKSSLIEMMVIMKGASKIDICMMNLALRELADFLLILKNKNATSIRIITDGSKDFRLGTKLPWLIKEGIPVKIPNVNPVGVNNANAYDRSIMHHKFAVIDSESVLMGSLNWTKNAVLNNREAVIVSRNKDAVVSLHWEFKKMWADFKTATLSDFPDNDSLANRLNY